MTTHAIYDLKRKPLTAKIIRWIMNEINTVIPLAEKSGIALMAADVPEEKINRKLLYINGEVHMIIIPFNAKRDLQELQ